jgi:hypothetical protein
LFASITFHALKNFTQKGESGFAIKTKDFSIKTKDFYFMIPDYFYFYLFVFISDCGGDGC